VRRRVVLIGAALALGATSCSASFGMPRGGTQQGKDIFGLWHTYFVAALVVGGIVYALIAWSLIRYRRRRSDPEDAMGASFRVHVPIEVVYTAIPIVIVVGLFAAAFRTEDRVDDVVPHPNVVLHAEAFAWGWRFTYDEPAGGSFTVVSPPSGAGVPGPVIELPLGETVRVVLTSDDVIHAFWVPGFLFKRDAIPGRTSEFDLSPTAAGTYRGECAEFCGLNHSYMVFTVKVVDPATYRSWIAAQQAGQEAAQT